MRTKFDGSFEGGVQWGPPGDYYAPSDLTTVAGIPGFFVAGTTFQNSLAAAYFTGMDPAAELTNYTYE